MEMWKNVKHWPWRSIVIGAAFISSIAAGSSFGTYAYFTSQAESKSAFAAGKLEIGLGTNAAVFESPDGQPFLPGVRMEKEMVLENKSDVPVKYAILASKADGDDVVYDQLMVEVRRGGSDGELLYAGRAKHLTRANVVSELAKDGKDQLHFTVYLPESAGNEVQQKSAEVEFRFLATQLENGEYFAQEGPVMTFTPADFSGEKAEDTWKVVQQAVEGTTVILAEGDYDFEGKELTGNITWKAEKGKNGKVKVKADGLRLSDVSVDGLAFETGNEGLIVGSNVSLVNCLFEGGAKTAVRTAEGPKLEGLTVQKSRFVGSGTAILLDQEIVGAMIADNTFEEVQHALVVANDKASEVQVVRNDFTGVKAHAVDSGGVRIGDGIEGFKEEAGKEGTKPRLALHLQKLDIYLEDNRYSR